MKPDQHKKKRSAQYKKKHGIAQKTNAATLNSKANSPSSTLKKTAAASDNVKPTGSGQHGQNESRPNHNFPSAHERARNGDFSEEESEEVKSFARRKIESNWDRYEPLDDDVDESYNFDGLKGADFKALLSQTGDASSQFRFKDEQLWEEESDLGKEQDSEGFPAVDCHDLWQRLMAIPLPKRLHIEKSFFEPSTLKSLDDLASRHREELHNRQASALTYVGKDKSCPIFSAPNRVVDAEGVGESSCLDSDDEKEANEQETQPGETGKEPSLEDDVKLSCLPELSARSQDDPDTIQQQIEDVSATHQDVRSSLENSEHAEDDEIFVEPEQISAEARECCLGREDQPRTGEQTDATEDPVSNLEDISNSDTNSTQQGHTRPPAVSPPVPKTQAQPKPLSEPKTDDSDNDDDDELNFLLGLENPVQARSKAVVASGRMDEDEGADEGLRGEGWERPASHPADAVDKPGPGHVQTSRKSKSPSQNGADSLEAWLDSVLEGD